MVEVLVVYEVICCGVVVFVFLLLGVVSNGLLKCCIEWKCMIFLSLVLVNVESGVCIGFVFLCYVVGYLVFYLYESFIGVNCF